MKQSNPVYALPDETLEDVRREIEATNIKLTGFYRRRYALSIELASVQEEIGSLEDYLDVLRLAESELLAQGIVA